jgi:hypothetical protein
VNWSHLLNPGIFGLAFLLLFLVLIWLCALIIAAQRRRTNNAPNLRIIPAFDQLKKTIGLSVEEGRRLHLSLGDGILNGSPFASALIGLVMLLRISRTAAKSDHPPVATSGDGLLAILSQDTQHKAYLQAGAVHSFTPLSGQVSGLSPWSYAAGTLPVIYDQKVTANILAGHFGSEIALIADASERNRNQLLAGSDSLPAQAILYTAAQEPLIGEELYTSGAYLLIEKQRTMHIASVKAQDILRWVLILAILTGVTLKLIGRL